MNHAYRVVIASAAGALAACSDNASGPNNGQSCAEANLIAVPTLQGITVPAENADCVDFEPGSGTYLIVPEFAAAATAITQTGFAIGATAAATTASSPMVADGIASASPPRGAQAEFDARMRAVAHATALGLPTDVRSRLSTTRVQASVLPPPPVGSTRVFSVCASLDCSSFNTDTAVLKFVGQNTLLYVSQHVFPPPQGFSDAQLSAFATIMDQILYPLDTTTFAPPSDIDNNGRVMILMSLLVNAITPASTCLTEGYVAGFFFPPDLVPTTPHSNGGELYYTIAPDPNGTASCAHTVQDVDDGNGATFLHELLHMINFNEKVFVNGLSDTEVEFLDEGMAKIAEELGSIYYETKYPPPLGRTNADQIFPDSAEGYISGDLFNSYQFLSSPVQSTATRSVGASTLGDAGAEWLFLRWLGDQQGESIFGRIVRSGLVGIPNVEAQSGRPYATLLGEVGLAVYTDSLVGVPRDQVPATLRYGNRRWREIYPAVFRAVGGPTPDFPVPFPITLKTISASTTITSAMLSGSMEFYKFVAPASGAPQRLRFSAPGGGALSSSLNAQVSVFHCPSDAACM